MEQPSSPIFLFLKKASGVGLWTILSRIGGFFREMMLAHFLGVGPVVDALVISLKLPSFIRRITAEGAMNTVFVPLLSKISAKEGCDTAERFASSVLGAALIFVCTAAALFAIFSPYLICFLFPKLKATPDRLQMVISYSRIMFPFVIFISATAIYGGFLNTLGRFWAFAASPFFGNLSIIIFALLGIFYFNMGPNPLQIGLVFAWAVLFSGVVQLSVVVIDAIRSGSFFFPRFPKNSPRLQQFFLKLGPAALSSGIAQVNLFVGLFIATFLPTGSISHLNYADRLVQMPLSVIGTALGVALLPSLATHISKKKTHLANAQQEAALATAILASALVFTLTLALSKVLVFLAYGRGRFTPTDVTETARALSAYVCGLPAYMISKILATRFFAKGQMATPVRAGLYSLVADIIFSVTLMGPLGHVGIAAASSISAWVNTAVLAFALHKKGEWHFSPHLKKLFGGVCFLTFSLSTTLAFFMPTNYPANFLNGLGILLFWVFGTGTIFLGAMRVFCWTSLKRCFPKL